MLAQLNRIPGVDFAQVEATGRRFLIFELREADSAAIEKQALMILGNGSSQLQNCGVGRTAARFDSEEIWLRSENIRGLSLLEAAILAAQWGTRAACAARLTEGLAVHLSEILRCELTREFDRVHSEGGTSERDWYLRAFPRAFDKVIAAMDTPPSQAASLRESLLSSLNR